MPDKPLLVILGATASGKTRLAVQVANKFDGEIISADSRQIFKQMDIGTGKDLDEYVINSKNIPYHLINILEAGERYHVDAFKNDFYKAYQTIQENGKLPILCGGTGMYIHSILQNQVYTATPVNTDFREELEPLSKEELVSKLRNYQSDSLLKVDLSSKKRLIRAIEIAEYLKYNKLEQIERPKISPIVIGLKNEIEITRKNILHRLEYRLNNGMIEEVENLLNQGISGDTLIFYGLEYKFIVNYLSGQLSYEDLKLKLGVAICQFAKRQNTFFRKMEKDGILINWLDASTKINLLQQQVEDIVLEFENKPFVS